MNGNLIRRAKQLIGNILPYTPFNLDESTRVLETLAALAGTLMELWESAVSASEPHQDILAALESAVRSLLPHGVVTNRQLKFLEEALASLAQENPDCNVIRSKFIEVGFPPLAFAR